MIRNSLEIDLNKVIFTDSISIDWLNKGILTTINCLNLLRMIRIPDIIFY